MSAPARLPPLARSSLAARPWPLEVEEEAFDDTDQSWEGPVRFDAWAVASAGVVLLGVLIIAWL